MQDIGKDEGGEWKSRSEGKVEGAMANRHGPIVTDIKANLILFRVDGIKAD